MHEKYFMTKGVYPLFVSALDFWLVWGRDDVCLPSVLLVVVFLAPLLTFSQAQLLVWGEIARVVYRRM